MADYIYCISNPSIPDVIRLDQSGVDPRQSLAELGSRAGSQRINWVVKVRESHASLQAVRNALADYADSNRRDHFHCEPMRARAVAIKYTNARTPEESDAFENASLPSLVLGLGLCIQFLSMQNDCIGAGASLALIVSALFWVVHTLPIGSRYNPSV